MVFIGTNGLRPAIGGGNNDNFFHGESRVIRYGDDDDDDDDDVEDDHEDHWDKWTETGDWERK